MDQFTAHRLTFQTQVEIPIELNEHQGSAIRGALFHALRRRFCAFARDSNMECAACALVGSCPVARLVSTLDPAHGRGQDRPRPFTIQPPLPGSGHPIEQPDGSVTFRYERGESLVFGLTLYADALNLFPYVVLATADFEAGGIGKRFRQANGRWERGALRIEEIFAEHPLTGQRQAVLRGDTRQVWVPDLPVTHAQVLAQPAPEGMVWLRFLTPTRLVAQERLVKPREFSFRPFLHRLIERLEALSQTFSPTPLALDVPALLDLAQRVEVVDNRLTWEELRSYSTRRHGESPTSGLVGAVQLTCADWSPLWAWVVWGQFVHVGKDAVKGNGWYCCEVTHPAAPVVPPAC